MPESATHDQDVLINQYALEYAQLKTASKALLGGLGGSDSESDGSGDEGANEQLLPVRTSETAGVGYIAPTTDDDGLATRQESAATQRLRRQLLGKNARPPAGTVSATGNMLTGHHSAASKPRPRAAAKRPDSDDEEEGRSGLGKKSESRAAVPRGKNVQSSEAQTESTETTTPTSAPPSKKRGGSYLDQVLADRANKKRKKKAATENG